MSISSNNPALSLDGLATYVAVVGGGSFSAGARARGIPRATVTRHVAALERKLGARLVERTTRRMVVTDAGAELYERAKRILEEVHAAEDATRERAGRVSGVLRVSLPIEYGMTFLAPVVASFASAHPDLRVSVELSSRRVDLVDERVDVAVRIGALPDSSYVARKVGAVALWLCAAPSLRSLPKRPDELARAPFVHFETPGMERRWTLATRGRTAVVTPPPGVLEANSYAVVREAALAGLGVARLPSFYASDAVEAGRLVRVLPRWSFPEVPVHALTLAGPRPARTRAFIAHLAAVRTP